MGDNGGQWRQWPTSGQPVANQWSRATARKSAMVPEMPIGSAIPRPSKELSDSTFNSTLDSAPRILVALEQVTKSYGPTRVLRDVSLEVRAGNVLAIVGPNGAGKSTLMAIAAGLAKPSFGRVRYAISSIGQPTESGTAGAPSGGERRPGIGWLGHDSLCYPDLTGEENLQLAARLNGATAEAIAEALKRFDIGDYAGRAFRTLSRGQKQRIALARALLHWPILVFLDEPTTGLDTAGTNMLADVVAAESTRGAAVIMVTHDEGFAARVGAEVYRLERGRLVRRDAS
jgi:heme ABC exporter ATP-binding subunit CcmA